MGFNSAFKGLIRI